MSNDIMKSYDYSDDDLFDFTDYNFDEQEIGRRRNVSSEKSIGNNKRCAKNVKRKNVSINRVKALIGSAILALSVYGGVSLVNTITDAIEYHNDTNAAIVLSERIMTERLIDTGSAHYEKGGDFSVKAMTVEDYSKLEIDTPEELFALMQVIDDDTELNNMVRAMSYVDTAGNVCNYTDFQQFLRVNGYYNEEGKADVEVFDNLCKNSLVNSYRNDTLEQSFNEAPTMGGMNR